MVKIDIYKENAKYNLGKWMKHKCNPQSYFKILTSKIYRTFCGIHHNHIICFKATQTKVTPYGSMGNCLIVLRV